MLPIGLGYGLGYSCSSADDVDDESSLNSCFFESTNLTPLIDYEALTPIYDVYDDDVEVSLPCENVVVEIIVDVNVVDETVVDETVDALASMFDVELEMEIPCVAPFLLKVSRGDSDDSYFLPMPTLDSRTNRILERENDTILRKLSSLRAFTKTDISEATVGVRRPTSTTFEDLFKGYNIVVYTKIRIQEEEGQNNPTMQQRRFLRGYGSAQVQLRLRPSRLKSKGCFVGPFS